jgi:hypothetical protein
MIGTAKIQYILDKGEENVTEDCIRYQTNSVVMIFMCCRVSETFDMATGEDSAILSVASRMKMINKHLLKHSSLLKTQS